VARRLFVAEGWAATSVASIVREAGVAQGTFYLYFKSKEQLLVHLRGGVLAEYIGAFETGARGPGTADARLVAGMHEIDRAVRRNAGLVRVFRQATTGDEAELVWLDGRDTFAAPLLRLLLEGAEDGSFEIDDPKMAAHLVLALFDDLLYAAHVYGRPASGRKTLTLGARFALRGLGVNPQRIDELVPLPAKSR